MTTKQDALNRYHSLYDNDEYQRIGNLIATELGLEREHKQVTDVMCLLTDSALGICKHPSHSNDWVKFAHVCAQRPFSEITIEALSNYLWRFQQSGDTHDEDFILTVEALRKLSDANNALKDAVSATNGIHGWRGRMAYDIVCASELLTQAAIQLLIHGNAHYICEKLSYGIRRIVTALRDAQHHADQPQAFTTVIDEFRVD